MVRFRDGFVLWSVFRDSFVLWSVFREGFVIWSVFRDGFVLWSVFTDGFVLWSVFWDAFVSWSVFRNGFVLWSVFKDGFVLWAVLEMVLFFGPFLNFQGFFTFRDLRHNFKWPSIYRWSCQIHNCTLYTFIWSKMWKILSGYLACRVFVSDDFFPFSCKQKSVSYFY